jgi:hypothetical protein
MKKVADVLLKNSITKPVYRKLGLKKLWVQQRHSPHYRMKRIEENGGVLVLKPYSGPTIDPKEWEKLEYTTYYTDPKTFFAPIASATGEAKMESFHKSGNPDKYGRWTPNAEVASSIVKWVESLGVPYGRVQLIRKDPNSRRETYWNLHLDDNNRLNPEGEGWVVRLWLELTDSPHSHMILRENEFSKSSELRIPLHKGAQMIIDSENLFHSVHHDQGKHDHVRYGVIVSLESCPALEKWIETQMPATPLSPSWAKSYKKKIGPNPHKDLPAPDVPAARYRSTIGKAKKSEKPLRSKESARSIK